MTYQIFEMPICDKLKSYDRPDKKPFGDKGMWYPLYSPSLLIKDMTDSHLVNAILWLDQKLIEDSKNFAVQLKSVRILSKVLLVKSLFDVKTLETIGGFHSVYVQLDQNNPQSSLDLAGSLVPLLRNYIPASMYPVVIGPITTETLRIADSASCLSVRSTSYDYDNYEKMVNENGIFTSWDSIEYILDKSKELKEEAVKRHLAIRLGLEPPPADWYVDGKCLVTYSRPDQIVWSLSRDVTTTIMGLKPEVKIDLAKAILFSNDEEINYILKYRTSPVERDTK